MPEPVNIGMDAEAQALQAKIADFSAEQLAAYDLSARITRTQNRRMGSPIDSARYDEGQERILWALFDTMLGTLESVARQADLSNDANVLEGECGKHGSVISSLCDCFYRSFADMETWPAQDSALMQGCHAIPETAKVLTSMLFGAPLFGSLKDDDGAGIALDGLAMANLFITCEVADTQHVPLAFGASMLLRGAAIVADRMLQEGRAIAARINAECIEQQKAEAETKAPNERVQGGSDSG